MNNIDLWVSGHVKSSLSRMCVNSVSGLLLHQSTDFLETPKRRLFDSLSRLKDDGVVNKIGVSIYNPDELDDIEKHGIKIDIVQAPFNILDRRIKTSGWLQKLNENNVEVHSRSIFLQGLLLMNPIERSKLFYKWQSIWSVLDTWLINNNISPIEAALGFVFSEKNIDCVIVGVESKNQLNEIISISNSSFNLKLPESLSTVDLDLIEPVNWI